MFRESEEKQDGVEVAVKQDAYDTPIHEKTQEDINAILPYGYEVNDDRLLDPENTPSATGNNDQPVYK